MPVASPAIVPLKLQRCVRPIPPFFSFAAQSDMSNTPGYPVSPVSEISPVARSYLLIFPP